MTSPDHHAPDATDTQPPRRAGRVQHVALLIATGLLLPALGAAVVVALLVYGLQCDDTCYDSEPGEAWTGRADAFEWTLQLWLAFGGLGFSALAFAMAVLRRDKTSAAATLAAVALGITWIIFLGHNNVGGF